MIIDMWTVKPLTEGPLHTCREPITTYCSDLMTVICAADFCCDTKYRNEILLLSKVNYATFDLIVFNSLGRGSVVKWLIMLALMLNVLSCCGSSQKGMEYIFYSKNETDISDID